MSGPNHDRDSDDDRTLRAAELVLGLTEPSGRAEAVANDPRLDAEISRWARNFAQLVGELQPVAPSPGVWDRLSRAVSRSPAVARRPHAPAGWRNSLGFWRAAAGTGLAASAMLALLWLVVPAEPPPPASSMLLMSSLLPKDGPPVYVATYDVARSVMIVVPADTQQHATAIPRLWFVPNDDGDPIPLGRLNPTETVAVKLTPEVAKLDGARAGLVVTLEPAGAPADAPTAAGPVIAHGRFTAY